MYTTFAKSKLLTFVLGAKSTLLKVIYCIEKDDFDLFLGLLLLTGSTISVILC